MRSAVLPRLDVNDINAKDLRTKNLYKRNVDPLDPIYQLGGNLNGPNTIGPIENQRTRDIIKHRHSPELISPKAQDIEGDPSLEHYRNRRNKSVMANKLYQAAKGGEE